MRAESDIEETPKCNLVHSFKFFQHDSKYKHKQGLQPSHADRKHEKAALQFVGNVSHQPQSERLTVRR